MILKKSWGKGGPGPPGPPCIRYCGREGRRSRIVIWFGAAVQPGGSPNDEKRKTFRSVLWKGTLSMMNPKAEWNEQLGKLVQLRACFRQEQMHTKGSSTKQRLKEWQLPTDTVVDTKNEILSGAKQNLFSRSEENCISWRCFLILLSKWSKASDQGANFLNVCEWLCKCSQNLFWLHADNTQRWHLQICIGKPTRKLFKKLAEVEKYIQNLPLHEHLYSGSLELILRYI